jgi:hypothetical protein
LQETRHAPRAVMAEVVELDQVPQCLGREWSIGP